MIVDGIDLEPFLAGNFFGTQPQPAPQAVVPPQPERRDTRSAPRYYICPKDETMMRVPAGRAAGDLHCPVDGTPMKSGTGRDSQIFLLD